MVDLTDVIKPYARKMEYLARVRDGSTKKLGNGYWCCQVVGLERGSAEVMPLDQELYSQEAPGFVSENDEILKAIGRVSKATQGRGVWVIDAGGDRKKILKVLLNQGLRFVVRQRGDRHLISGRQRKSVQEWAAGCRRQHREVVVKETSSGEKVYRLEFGFRKVRWPGRTEALYLVVVDGLGPNPLILLTNRKVTRSRKSQWRVVESYLGRWRVEETIRFIKQSYQLEDIRLLKYERLRNLVMLVLATAYFASVYLGKTGQAGDPGTATSNGPPSASTAFPSSALRACGWDQAALVRPEHGNWTASSQSLSEPASLVLMTSKKMGEVC